MAMNIDPALLLEEIRANQKRLDECKRHHFPTLPPTDQIGTMLGLKLTCSKCGGIMDARMAASYTRGYAAAGGDPNEIIPNWN